MIADSFELLERLWRLNPDIARRDPWWWPNSGTFEVLIGALLTQNTRWENVEAALANLRQIGALEPKALEALDVPLISEAVRPAGFYRTKAVRLHALAQAIVRDFGDFALFSDAVERSWLLAQKGIGEESADAILNYACYKEAMVVDAYTNRLLAAMGFCFESYGQIQSWLVEGLQTNAKKVENLFSSYEKARIYALFHGLIVEYVKAAKRRKAIDLSMLS